MVSKIKNKKGDSIIEEGSLIKDAMDQVKNRFEKFRKIHYNPNTKGYNYEKICGKFFESYLGSLYDFSIRASVVDYEGKYDEVFKRGENEFDVVATYKTAIPKIVLEVEHETIPLKFIPLDAVAFISEIKQTLTKSFLNKDLEKLKKLSRLPISKGRMRAMNLSSRICKNDKWEDRFIKEGVPIPKILIYYERKINEQTFNNILINYKDYWDAIVLVEKDLLLLNQYSVLNFFCEGDRLVIRKENPLFWLLILISLSLPIPSRVLTANFFIKYLLPEVNIKSITTKSVIVSNILDLY